MSTHNFEVADAVEFGLPAAVLIQNLRFWIQHNKANGKHEHGGRTWTYNSAKAFAQLFPYLSPDQVKRVIKKLVDDGVIITRALSDNAWNRVNWYAFVDEPRMLKMPQSPEVQHSAESPNASGEIAQSTERNRPITEQIKNTDVNADKTFGQVAAQPARVSSSKSKKDGKKSEARDKTEAAVEFLKTKDVSEQTARDWIEYRSENRGKITMPVIRSVIASTEAEAEQVCLTLEEALTHVCCFGGFDFTVDHYLMVNN
jgi:hypothetical protein